MKSTAAPRRGPRKPKNGVASQNHPKHTTEQLFFRLFPHLASNCLSGGFGGTSFSKLYRDLQREAKPWSTKPRPKKVLKNFHTFFLDENYYQNPGFQKCTHVLGENACPEGPGYINQSGPVTYHTEGDRRIR